MKIANNYELSGKVIKNNDTYRLVDNRVLNNLTVSTTRLKQGHITGGHSHDHQEEVYIFLSGKGEMILGDQTIPVEGGDVVVVPINTHHQVTALNGFAVYFMCVFEGGRHSAQILKLNVED
jgi:mannose-6-phosphate isomerase-like protein (cupin superfamily)